MISDTDWALLDKRLEEIERSIGILQVYVDTSLKEKYYGDNGDVAYVLKKGSLIDAGLDQQWQHIHKGEDNV